MKVIVKKVFVIICIISIFFALTGFSKVSAEGGYDFMKQIENQTNGVSSSEAVGSVENIAGTIITVARVITTGVAVVMLVVLAMKYMMSAPGDRATIKKHAVVYIVGAIVMFASTGILGIIQKFSEGVNK